MPDYVLARSVEDDLEQIADYTVRNWGADQALRYCTALDKHFAAVAANEVRAKPVFGNWPELVVSRCQHHFVFSLKRTGSPIAILAVFHESMDLPARLRERLDAEGQMLDD